MADREHRTIGAMARILLAEALAARREKAQETERKERG
jgi:hypothetical protein